MDTATFHGGKRSICVAPLTEQDADRGYAGMVSVILTSACINDVLYYLQIMNIEAVYFERETLLRATLQLMGFCILPQMQTEKPGLIFILLIKWVNIGSCSRV